MAAVIFNLFGLNMCVGVCMIRFLCGRIVAFCFWYYFLVWNNKRAKRYTLSEFEVLQRLSNNFVLFKRLLFSTSKEFNIDLFLQCVIQPSLLVNCLLCVLLFVEGVSSTCQRGNFRLWL